MHLFDEPIFQKQIFYYVKCYVIWSVDQLHDQLHQIESTQI